MIGRLMRKTLDHRKCSMRKPPSSGPSAAPPVVPIDQIAMARVRWPGSSKVSRTIDRVEGMIAAPKMPMRKRPRMRISAVGASAQTRDAAAKPAAPTRSTRLRPYRSAILPTVTSSPAMVKA